MIRNIVKKIIGGATNPEIPKEDAQVELERIKSDMAVFVNKIKICKELIGLDFIEERIASYTNDIKKGKTLAELALIEKELAVYADDIKQCKALVELPLIEEKIASYADNVKKGKALIDQIESFPDGTWLVPSEEDPDNKVEDQIKYERYDGWLKESLLKFVKGQYSGNQRRLRELKKRHKELMSDD